MRQIGLHDHRWPADPFLPAPDSFKSYSISGQTSHPIHHDPLKNCIYDPPFFALTVIVVLIVVAVKIQTKKSETHPKVVHHEVPEAKGLGIPTRDTSGYINSRRQLGVLCPRFVERRCQARPERFRGHWAGASVCVGNGACVSSNFHFSSTSV